MKNTSAATDNHLLDSAVKHIAGHEFRTPMTAIIGYAHLMHDHAGEISAAEQKEFTGHILDSAQRLMNASTRLYAWFELKSNRMNTLGRFTLSKERILELIVEEGGMVCHSGECFSFTSAVDLLHVSGSEEICIMALREVISNAFKFSKKGTLVQFAIAAEEGHYFLRISNVTEKARSFDYDQYEAFTQFHRKKYEQQGLGLGLEIARLGIRLCKGGSFDVYTEQFDQHSCKVCCAIRLSICG